MGSARIDAADALWLIAAAAFALLAAPGLALFYGSRAPRKTLRVAVGRALWAIAIVAIQWLLLGYSLAFGPSWHGLVGSLAFATSGGSADGSGPRVALAVVAFRMMFALTLPAMIAGAFADRMKFRAFVAFVLAWSTLVFDPIAHWTWSGGGWIARLGVLDFAGGTVVHLTAAISALVCVAAMAHRSDAESLRLDGRSRSAAGTWAGAGLLWCSQLAFNAAGGLPSVRLALLAFVATLLGALAGGLGWLVVEWRDTGRVGWVGVPSGLVAGLIAIAPAAGYVSPSAAAAIGFIGGAVGYGTALGAAAGLSAALLAITADAGYVAPSTAVALAIAAGGICYGAVLLRERFGLSRLRDAFASHAVAALAGTLLTGVFAQKALNENGSDGALFGNSQKVAVELLACVVVATYAAFVTFVILKLVGAAVGLGKAEEAGVEEDLERCDITGVRERRPGAARARDAASI